MRATGSTPDPGRQEDVRRAARRWRRAAAVASGAAVCVPTPMVTLLLLGPLAPHAPGLDRGWGLVLWPFTLAGGLLLGGAEAVEWSPLIGAAIALVWALAAALAPRWPERRARAALAAAGAAAFALAGAARAVLLTRLASHRAPSAYEWGLELRWALLPLALLGAAAGACLARARATRQGRGAAA